MTGAGASAEAPSAAGARRVRTAGRRRETPSRAGRWYSTRFVKFAVVGVANTGITFLVFNLTTRLLHLPAAGGNAVGWLAGCANSFLWNSVWTFRDRRHLVRRQVLSRFALANAVALGVSTAVVVGLQAAAAAGGVATTLPAVVELNAIEVAAVGCSLIVNYVISSRWAFRET